MYCEYWVYSLQRLFGVRQLLNLCAFGKVKSKKSLGILIDDKLTFEPHSLDMRARWMIINNVVLFLRTFSKVSCF